MAILDVLLTLSVIGAVLVMGAVIVAFLKLRGRLRKSMVTTISSKMNKLVSINT